MSSHWRTMGTDPATWDAATETYHGALAAREWLTDEVLRRRGQGDQIALATYQGLLEQVSTRVRDLASAARAA